MVGMFVGQSWAKWLLRRILPLAHIRAKTHVPLEASHLRVGRYPAFKNMIRSFGFLGLSNAPFHGLVMYLAYS